MDRCDKIRRYVFQKAVLQPSDIVTRFCKPLHPTMHEMVDDAMQAHLVPGTDSGVASPAFDHLDVDGELQLLVEVGLTPLEAFIVATRTTILRFSDHREASNSRIQEEPPKKEADGHAINDDRGPCLPN